jgi:hypothetical protein
MTIMEAWHDFDKWLYTPPAPHEPIPWDALSKSDRNRIRVARYAAQGKLMRKGKVVPLGVRQLQAILEKYAPGRYRFETVIYLNT